MAENFTGSITDTTQSTVHCLFQSDTDVYHNADSSPSKHDVVSMLVQRRWRWASSETPLGQILAFAELHTGVCLHPPLPHHNILASRSRYF